MASLFRKGPKTTIPPEFRMLFERTTHGIAWASALANVVGRHAAEIKAGTVPFPVMEAPGVTTVQRWHHLRLEACLGAVRYGDGSLLELADIRTQREALTTLLDQRAHLWFPQPSGNAMANSIQGMWQAYLYLGEWGSTVADPTTDPLLLRGRLITGDLEREAGTAQRWWQALFADPDSAAMMSPDQAPVTLFELFFDDLNRKTKSIALSKLLGPDHAEGEALFVGEVQEKLGESEVSELCKFLAVLRAADNPDQALERTAQLRMARRF